MPWPRAYLGIAACAIAAAGCNQVFGLDDEAGLLQPDAPPDPVPRLCIDDPFDSLLPVWQPFDPADVFPIEVTGGELRLTVGAQNQQPLDGLITATSYDLTGGSVEIRVTNPTTPTSRVDVGIDVRVGASWFRITSFQGGVGAWFSDGTSQELFGQATVKDPVLRLRHDPAGNAMIYETAEAPGAAFTMRETRIVPPVDDVTIAITGRIAFVGDGTIDQVTLDDFRLTALCP